MRGREKSRAQSADVELRFEARIEPNERPVNIARIRPLIVRLAIEAWRRRESESSGATHETHAPAKRRAHESHRYGAAS